jgi:hypothetical protein
MDGSSRTGLPFPQLDSSDSYGGHDLHNPILGFQGIALDLCNATYMLVLIYHMVFLCS